MNSALQPERVDVTQATRPGDGQQQAPASRRRLGRAGKFVITRLALIPATLFVIVSCAFLLVELMPGDPALAILGNTANAEEVERVRSELGLDQTLGTRYFTFLGDAARGDLGNSFFTGQPVLDDIFRFLPASIELVSVSLLLAALVGIGAGAIAGYYRSRMPDGIVRVIVTTLQALPEFLIGLLLIFFLFYLWRIAPAPLGRLGLMDVYPPAVTGFLTIDLIIARDWSTLQSMMHRSMLPVLTLTLGAIAYFAKITRSAVAASMSSRQVQFARACGLPEWRVLHYALLTARTQILTYTAILFGAMIGGSSIIETMFAWQGLGQWGLAAILARDIPAIQGFVIATGLMTMIVYLLLDIVVALLDPRIRHD
jgi:ABC-type dipeptide/oligopeptide/nickel transport system permease component